MPSDLFNSLSPLARLLVEKFENTEAITTDKKISVNILVSKVAYWYEKVRTAMDYGNEETLLRRAIERILKRRLFLDPDSKSLAEILVRELIWAGYFPDETVPESIINKVSDSIALYLKLKNSLVKERILPESRVYELIMELLSCEIDVTLLPNKEKDGVSNFMFQILKNSVEIVDDTKQVRDAQVFIAVRKNFARDDIAFLRYRLFVQIFGKLSENNFEETVRNFQEGFKEINSELSYPRKDRIFNHVKKKTPPFLILYDVLLSDRGHIKELVGEENSFKEKVFAACEKRYESINKKVRTAIIRSFIFILFTKALIALSIEGTFERIFLGHVAWLAIALNIIVPPFLMIVLPITIKQPGIDNSERIFSDIKKVLFEENPGLIRPISVKLKTNSVRTIRDYIFSVLWFLAFILSFGLVTAILNKLNFNILSQGIFLFFLAIVSFLTYRIYQTANTYTVFARKSLIAPLIDFFFVPIIRVGRRLTEGIAQINFIIIIIDFIIEAPFKGLVGFFEQWFMFLSIKREELE